MEVLNRKENLEDKSNNQILVEMREMRLEHDSIKEAMLKSLTKLEEIEKKYDNHNKELYKRLKG